jgi:hypothetical protein
MPVIVLDVLFVNVSVYGDARPATTGGGTETLNTPVGDVALSANPAGTRASEAAATASALTTFRTLAIRLSSFRGALP